MGPIVHAWDTEKLVPRTVTEYPPVTNAFVLGHTDANKSPSYVAEKLAEALANAVVRRNSPGRGIANAPAFTKIEVRETQTEFSAAEFPTRVITSESKASSDLVIC